MKILIALLGPDYEIFGDFENSNLNQVFYLLNDTVIVLLRSDTNTKGYCEWFNFGLRFYPGAKSGLKITIKIVNLRKNTYSYEHF